MKYFSVRHVVCAGILKQHYIYFIYTANIIHLFYKLLSVVLLIIVAIGLILNLEIICNIPLKNVHILG